MVFDVARWQGPQELKKLSPYAGGSIENEGQQRWQNNAHWLWQRRVYWSRGYRSSQISERVASLAVGLGGEER